jgi:hypothetical protein
VFSYLRGFTFELKDERAFNVGEGKTIEILAIAWEKGDATTALEQRPALRFVEKLRPTSAPTSGAPVSPASRGSAGAGAR